MGSRQMGTKSCCTFRIPIIRCLIWLNSELWLRCTRNQILRFKNAHLHLLPSCTSPICACPQTHHGLKDTKIQADEEVGKATRSINKFSYIHHVQNFFKILTFTWNFCNMKVYLHTVHWSKPHELQALNTKI